MKSWRTEMTIWTDLAGIGFRLDYVDAGGTRTRALIAGAGQDIIALHGPRGHLEAFSRNIVPHVRAGYRIHAIDALGHGCTDKPPPPNARKRADKGTDGSVSVGSG